PGFAAGRHFGRRDGGRTARKPPARAVLPAQNQVILFATLLSTPLTLVPTLPMATMAATAISEAISVYSMAVAPCSFFIRRRKMDSIAISKGKNVLLIGVLAHRPGGSGDR